VRVLLTRLSALGDIVHTWPLVDLLRRDLPEMELGWVVEEPFLTLVAGNPAVDRVFVAATKRWRRRPATALPQMGTLRRELRAFAPHIVLDPQGLVKSAVWGWLSGAAQRVGLAAAVRRERLAGLFYTTTVLPGPTCRHVVDINLALAAELGVAPEPGLAPDGRFLVGPVPGQTSDRPKVALLPATGGAGKAWPVERFAELARTLWASGIRPVAVWGPGEREVARQLVELAPGAQFAPPTDLAALVKLFAGCAAVVGGDTGPVHLAASLGVPTVAVFVSTDPERNGVRGARTAMISGTVGAGRRGSARNRTAREVDVAEVHAALLGLLRAP
jgi:heptosyltransferase I